MGDLPARLERDTIVETIFEIRFNSDTKSVASLLPGIVFSSANGALTQITELDTLKLPPEVLLRDPSFRYASHYRLSSDQFYVNIGEHSFSVCGVRPYMGWKAYQEKILLMMGILKESGLIANIERFSLKYTNVVPRDKGESFLADLDVEMRMGPHSLGDRPTLLRTEIEDGGFLNIVQVSTHVSAMKIDLPSNVEQPEDTTGTLFDIDTIYMKGGLKDFWERLPAYLNEAHDAEKKVFYSILRNVDKFGPVWE